MPRRLFAGSLLGQDLNIFNVPQIDLTSSSPSESAMACSSSCSLVLWASHIRELDPGSPPCLFLRVQTCLCTLTGCDFVRLLLTGLSHRRQPAAILYRHFGIVRSRSPRSIPVSPAPAISLRFRRIRAAALPPPTS